MLSQTVEYALRAMVYLASEPDGLVTSEQLSRATVVPQAYLSKVMKQLVAAGLVTSQRGVGGGFLLARAAHEVTILEVVNAVDPLQRIRTCPLGLVAHGKHLCPLHRRMDDALDAMERAFARSTLAEVVAEPTTSKPLCEFPAKRKKQ